MFSLHRRFVMIFAAIFALGGAAGYRFFIWYTDDVVSVLGQRLVERNALYEKAQLLGLMTREVTLAKKMASSPVLKDWIAHESDPHRTAHATAEMEDYRQFFRSKSSFLVIADSGNYYFNDDKGGHPLDQPRYTLNPNILKDGWFYATLRNVKDVQLNVDTDRHLALTRVWINAVMHDNKGRAIAVAGSGVDLSDFIQSVIRKQANGGSNLLIDERGAIQAHQDMELIDFASVRKGETLEYQKTLDSLLSRPADAALLADAMKELIAGERDVRSLEVTIQGHPQLLGIAWIPEVRWFVVSMMATESGALASHLPGGIMLLMAALVTVLIVATLLVEHLVMRRLDRLDKATAQLATGNYAVDLNDGSRDEIGRLTRAFAAMARRVATYTDDLKKQVAERTAELVALASSDPLTGLLNRRGMSERLNGEMNRLRREHRRFGLLHIDLDFFKAINDQHGHAAGDAVLVSTANCLKRSIRDYDACARWGGEEFLVALFNLADEQELESVALKLCAAVREQTVVWQGQTIRVTCSIGALMAIPDADLDNLLSRVDTACYAAKAAGRDQLIVERGR